ncbi:MAG: DUF4153 domain-containing protein [Saprospiraceae bacterium]|nr:DUF4153 domain-containing protein [Saprospiraceae bacterium]
MNNLLQKINIQGRFAEISKRFPLVMIFALITTITLILTVEDDSGKIFRWPVAGFIGFLAALLWTLYCEAQSFSRKIFITGTLILIILLGIFYMMIPTDFSTGHPCFWLSTIGLSIVLHLLISLIPYTKNYNTSHFISYNVTLFNSWMQSALFALLAYLALVLAILALDELFNLDVNSIFYFRLFIFITGLVQTTLFLSEIPDKFDESPAVVPKSVFKVIVAYLFIPVTILYAVILYAYFFRLILTDHSMVQWTYIMVLWYLSIGVLTWLLSGYLDHGDKSYISVFRKWFFILSIVPLVMLFFSVNNNIEMSGIREEFYFSALAAVIISLIFMYFFISKNKDYRIWPIAGILFCVIAFWSGPFSACKVPVINQQKKLVQEMETKGMIKDRIMVVDKSKKYQDSAGIITNKLYYLESRNALGYIKDYDKNNLITSPKDSITSSDIIKSYGLNTFFPTSNIYKEYTHPAFNTYDIKGYDLIIPMSSFGEALSKEFLKVDGQKCILYIDGNKKGEFDVSDFVS